MPARLMMVPVILREGAYRQSDLEQLGEVTKVAEGWDLEYIAGVNYFGDDETFMCEFWAAASSLAIEINDSDLIRFDWDRMERVKYPLPG